MRVHTQVARSDIYEQGKYVKDEKTKSGKRRDRSQPYDKNDRIIVKKGQTYYWWQFRHSPKTISTTYPKASQLTQSAYLSAVYDINDELSNVRGNVSSADDVQSFVDDIKSRIEELRDEQEEKRSNMPDSLQESPTGELLQERYDACDNAVSELDSIVTDYDEPDESELIDDMNLDEGEEPTEEEIEQKREEKLEEWLDEVCDEISNIQIE